jgi:hypothetical protein
MDSVAVPIQEQFRIRAHRGLLRHDVAIWVPPAHVNCRCRIVPESAIEHGIITRTARFSQDEVGRARLKSRISDLISQGPEWMDEDYEAVAKAGWSELLHPRGTSGKFIVLGAGLGTAALVGHEAAAVYATHQQTKHGYAVTRGFIPHRRYKSIRGITNAPLGTEITQASHPAGTYLVSMASLAPYRSRSSVQPSMDPAKLRRAMKKHGFTHPVLMRVHPDGAVLWDGNHRLDLAEQLGIDAVPVKISHDATAMMKPLTLLAYVNQLRQQRYRQQVVARYETAS